jgi:hypothetical protein
LGYSELIWVYFGVFLGQNFDRFGAIMGKERYSDKVKEEDYMDGHVIFYEGDGHYHRLATFEEMDEYVTQMKEGCPICGAHRLSLLIIPIKNIGSSVEVICENGCDPECNITKLSDRKCKYEDDITDINSL